MAPLVAGANPDPASLEKRCRPRFWASTLPSIDLRASARGTPSQELVLPLIRRKPREDVDALRELNQLPYQCATMTDIREHEHPR